MAFISLYLFCFLVIVNFYLSYVTIIYLHVRFSRLLFCSSNKTKSLMTALSSFLLQIGIVGGRNLIVFVGTLLLCNTSLNMFLGRMILIIDFVIQSRILEEEEEKKGYLLLGKGTIGTDMTLDHRNRQEEHTLSPQKKHWVLLLTLRVLYFEQSEVWWSVPAHLAQMP